MEIVEQGPRVYVVFDADVDLGRLEEGLTDGGYETQGTPRGGSEERRYRHPNGSVVRLFPDTEARQIHLAAYPPGGTRHQTGPIARFSPLKVQIDKANDHGGFGDEADEEAATADGSGDSPTDDGADDGDSE